jgi:hypothetical protein
VYKKEFVGILIDSKTYLTPVCRISLSSVRLEESLLEVIEFLAALCQQRLVDVWDNTTSCDGGFDE